MGKIEIVRNYKLMKSGLKDLKSGKMIIPCNYPINNLDMITDVDKLVDGIYVLKNKYFNHEIVLGIYFKNDNYLLPLSSCQITFFHYTDFNVLFTHYYNAKDFTSAIIFDNNEKFITQARFKKITEYDKEKINELGILTDNERVYLINGEFYTYTKIQYPLTKNNTYPFTRLKDRIITKVESDYGEKVIEVDSIAELDYKQDLFDLKMEEVYNNNDYLQEKYPKVKCKKMSRR